MKPLKIIHWNASPEDQRVSIYGDFCAAFKVARRFPPGITVHIRRELNSFDRVNGRWIFLGYMPLCGKLP